MYGYEGIYGERTWRVLFHGGVRLQNLQEAQGHAGIVNKNFVANA